MLHLHRVADEGSNALGWLLIFYPAMAGTKSCMRHRQPLTRDELRAMGKRNRGNPDVIALLWEIHRLRSIVLRSDQLQRSLPPNEPPCTALGLILGALREDLDGEPAVLGSRANKAEFLQKRTRGSS